MTIVIADNSPRKTYTATAGQTNFPTDFAFFSKPDVNVYVDDVLKTLDSDYSIPTTGPSAWTSGNDGTIVFSPGLSAGQVVVLTRDVELERTTDFPTSGPFQVSSLNVELDKLIAMMADMKDLADRGLRLSDSDTSAALVLANKDDRKGTVLAFNETTGAVEIGPTIADTNSIAQIKADIATLADIQDGTVATNAITTVSSISSDVTTVSSNNANVTTVAGQTTNMQNITDNLTAVQNAATNATNAAASATAAATSETNAATSETNAATSATNASTSATAASTSATAAASSATSAASSETAAATSETNAGTSETNAATSATSAGTSETNAASSATSAASSATSAASAQTAAESARDSALAAYDNFDDRYLGVKSSDPTVDNDGDALVAGALYFNSTSEKFLVYTGSAWADAYADGTTLVSKSGDTMTGNLSFGDNNKAIFGAGNDLQIYHTGNDSVIADGGIGNLNILGDADVAIINAASTEYKARFITDGAVELYYNGTQKLATTSTGIDVTGNASFDDNGKAIFGAGSDLQIYHDGSNSYIDESGSGSLIVEAVNLYFRKTDGENYIRAIADQEVTLYYNNSAKLATTSTGIDVTGTVTADGLTVQGDAVINLASTTGTTLGQKGGLELFAFSTTVGNGGEITWQSGTGSTETWAAISGYITNNTAQGSAGHVVIGTKENVTDTGLSERMRIAKNGDISFYEDTGTTAKFFWDASAEALGLGTSSPSAALDFGSSFYNGTPSTLGQLINKVALYADGSGPAYGLGISDGALNITAGANGDIRLHTNGVNERLRITDTGLIGIGESNPATRLEIKDATPILRLTDSLNGTQVSGHDIAKISFFSDDFSGIGPHETGFILNESDQGGTSLSGALVFGTAPYNTAATERLRITSAGLVGIGTTSPSTNLHVSSSGDTIVRVTSADGNGAFLDLGDASDPDGGRIVYDSGSNLTFSTASTERMRIKSDGSVGIGVTSNITGNLTLPNDGIIAFHDAAGNGRNSLQFLSGELRHGGAGAGLTSQTFYTNGQQRVRIDSAGRVGIGTTSPTNSITTTGALEFTGNAFNGSGTGIWSPSTNELGLVTSGSTQVRITSTGLVGIGTSSPSSLIHGSGLNAELRLQHTGNSYYQRIFTDSSNNLKFGTGANGTERMRISSAGDVLISTTSNIVANSSTSSGTSIGSGLLESARAGVVAQFNRQNSDGSVIDIQRSGTTVGSIGTAIGNAYFAGSSTGITFGSANVYPTNASGTKSNGTLTLGSSSNRFDDLHLSGTAHTGLNIHLQDSGITRGKIELNASDTDDLDIKAVSLGSNMKFFTVDTERARLDASANLLVGTTSDNVANQTGTTQGVRIAGGSIKNIQVASTGITAYFNRLTTDGNIAEFRKNGTTVGHISTVSSGMYLGTSSNSIRFTSSDIRPVNASGANTTNTVDLGDSSARFKDFYLGGVAYISDGTSSGTQTVVGGNYYIANSGAYPIVFQTNSAERARLDTSGNLLVGTTSAGTTGSQLRANGQVRGNSSAIPVFANRIGSSGVNIRLQNNSTTAGGIGTAFNTTFIYGTGGGVTDTGLIFANAQIVPCNGSGVGQDDLFDLGTSTSRFDDVFATNGTINTSDGDEKQDIEELTEAEHRVAVAVKGLLRKFRWKSRVEEKGDDARIHFGIIAQDLQAAFESEGLDAGRYAMFINSTWTDEETGEERSRMGVRYNELLAFIIAAI